ncbi:hypothetical protein CB1_000533022 [Camelus ferus]|nr:hypothetical protein CB1_000533022 [Camelus ferus]
MIPGIVDLELIREALRTPKPQTPGAYRFGRLSHHSFFSRHHPHPQHVTHIQEAWRKELKDLASRVAVFTKENELKNKKILELLSQILQTDSLNAIQFWLLYAPPKENIGKVQVLRMHSSQNPEKASKPKAEG